MYRRTGKAVGVCWLVSALVTEGASKQLGMRGRGGLILSFIFVLQQRVNQ